MKDTNLEKKTEETKMKLRKILKKANFLEVKFIQDAIDEGNIEIEDILDMVEVEREAKFKEWTKGFAAGWGSALTGLAIVGLIEYIRNK